MMDKEINPFQELYVTEAAQPEEFVQLFSPFLVEHTLMMFQHGNVVVKGTQGSGKSMLLNLLKPDIRSAYHKTGIGFPVPSRLSRFIGAGINLTRSGSMDIGQIPIGHDREEDKRLFPLYFADFLNYWIVRDVINSVMYMAEYPEVFTEINNVSRIDKFARLLANDNCWFGYLKNVTDIQSLRTRLDERLTHYRLFHQANQRRLPEELKSSKTRISIPISITAEYLEKSGVIHKDIPVFIRIDQIEALHRSDDLRPDLGVQYRRIINKALSMRDPRVSYRVGARTYTWREDILIYGTETPMELERDYRVIDLDDIVRRKENVKWIFPEFAEDIFARRLSFAKIPVDIKSKGALKTIFGQTPEPESVADEYVGNNDAARALKLEKVWPKHWLKFLETLFERNRLSAKLAEAWLRQGRGEEVIKEKLSAPPPEKDFPWERTYWKKERVRQALMQLAARCAQRLIWSGKDSVVALSTGSTLIFVSVCQHIWDAFLRAERGKPEKAKTNILVTGIDRRVQAVGIQTASTYWYHKIAEQPGGSDRKRFIDRLGRLFYERLINDRAMSYPGHNGFSLTLEEVEADQDVNQFLGDAVAYGDLFEAPHTTKLKDARQRIKWYLNPILSPHFRLPETHVKEPMYVKIADVKKWMKQAQVSTQQYRLKQPVLKEHKLVDPNLQLPLLPADID